MLPIFAARRMLNLKLFTAVFFWHALWLLCDTDNTTVVAAPLNSTETKVQQEYDANEKNFTLYKSKINSLNHKLDTYSKTIDDILSSPNTSLGDQTILKELQTTLNYAKSNGNLKEKEDALQKYQEALANIAIRNIQSNKSQSSNEQTIGKVTDGQRQSDGNVVAMNLKLDSNVKTIENILNGNTALLGDRAVLGNLKVQLKNARDSSSIFDKERAILLFDDKLKDYGIFYLGGDGKKDKIAITISDEYYSDNDDCFWNLWECFWGR